MLFTLHQIGERFYLDENQLNELRKHLKPSAYRNGEPVFGSDVVRALLINSGGSRMHGNEITRPGISRK